MRYFLVRYLKKPNGQMDEEVTVTKNLRLKDVQSSAVVLDFRKQQVVQCSLNGTTVPKNWDRVLSFYYQFYKSTIDRLCKENNLKIVSEQPSGKENEKNHPY